MTDADGNAVLAGACARLAEHFENALVLVTWVDEDGKTRHGQWHAGNALALRELAREHVAEHERQMLARVIQDSLDR